KDDQGQDASSSGSVTVRFAHCDSHLVSQPRCGCSPLLSLSGAPCEFCGVATAVRLLPSPLAFWSSLRVLLCRNRGAAAPLSSRFLELPASSVVSQPRCDCSPLLSSRFLELPASSVVSQPRCGCSPLLL